MTRKWDAAVKVVYLKGLQLAGKCCDYGICDLPSYLKLCHITSSPQSQPPTPFPCSLLSLYLWISGVSSVLLCLTLLLIFPFLTLPCFSNQNLDMIFFFFYLLTLFLLCFRFPCLLWLKTVSILTQPLGPSVSAQLLGGKEGCLLSWPLE